MELHGSDVVNMCQQQCPIHLKMNGVLVNQVPGQNWMDSHQNWVMLLQQNHQKIKRSKEIDYEEVPPPQKKKNHHRLFRDQITIIIIFIATSLIHRLSSTIPRLFCKSILTKSSGYLSDINNYPCSYSSSLICLSTYLFVHFSYCWF